MKRHPDTLQRETPAAKRFCLDACTSVLGLLHNPEWTLAVLAPVCGPATFLSFAHTSKRIYNGLVGKIKFSYKEIWVDIASHGYLVYLRAIWTPETSWLHWYTLPAHFADDRALATKMYDLYDAWYDFRPLWKAIFQSGANHPELCMWIDGLLFTIEWLCAEPSTDGTKYVIHSDSYCQAIDKAFRSVLRFSSDVALCNNFRMLRSRLLRRRHDWYEYVHKSAALAFASHKVADAWIDRGSSLIFLDRAFSEMERKDRLTCVMRCLHQYLKRHTTSPPPDKGLFLAQLSWHSQIGRLSQMFSEAPDGLDPEETLSPQDLSATLAMMGRSSVLACENVAHLLGHYVRILFYFYDKRKPAIYDPKESASAIFEASISCLRDDELTRLKNLLEQFGGKEGKQLARAPLWPKLKQK